MERRLHSSYLERAKNSVLPDFRLVTRAIQGTGILTGFPFVHAS